MEEKIVRIVYKVKSVEETEEYNEFEVTLELIYPHQYEQTDIIRTKKTTFKTNNKNFAMFLSSERPELFIDLDGDERKIW